MNERALAMSDVLREHGHRLTAARRAILEALASSGGHVSAGEVAVSARQRWPGVGRMTVYRTLDLLVELGLVRPVYQRSGAARYVILEGGRHHHLICSRCDQVLEIEECLVDEIEARVEGGRGFMISGHLVEIYGLCAECC